MSDLAVVALSARTAAFLVAPEGARYHLPRTVGWRLSADGGPQVAEGATGVAPLFVEGLEPGTRYRLETEIGAVAFRTPSCAGLVDVTDHGASPESDDNAAAFARAVAAVPPDGTLFVPPGRFVTRPVFLRPDTTLYLPAGAEIAAHHDRARWPVLPARDGQGRIVGTWEGVPEAAFAAPVTAIGCDRLTITGRGTIDGGGDRSDWWTWPKETRDGARRPRALHLAHCTDVSLTGFTVRNAPSWSVHPYRCDRLIAAALVIESPPDSPNTDGFDPESCLDVTVTGLRISVGDDCIAVKAGKRAPGETAHLAPTRRLSVTHCLMERGHGAVVLGSEMSGEITDVRIAGCEFVGTDRGLRIKTRRGRGGTVARVAMREVAMRDVATPLAVNAFYFCDPDGKSEQVQSRQPAPVDETTPRIEDIEVEGVTADGVRIAAAAILGLPEAPVRKVRLHGFSVSYDPGAEADVPLMALGVPAVRHAGIVAENAEVLGGIEVRANERETAAC